MFQVLKTTILPAATWLFLTALASAVGAADLDDGMVLLPAGSYPMGYEHSHEDELPIHEVRLDAFYIDATEVTNRQFAHFVEATGFTTQAEKDGYAWCFVKGTDDFKAVDGANWRHPNGPDSSIKEIMDHPVVCVSWEDAAAYAKWAGKRLPTEAEWEYAARSLGKGHIAAAPGKSPDGTAVLVRANIWQGTWPEENKLEDEYYYTAPVGSFPPNEIGIYDMTGNVWEWCADWYAADYYANSPTDNPPGPDTGEKRIARGGSWFCSEGYCSAYSSHYRGASPPAHAFNNVGFRCAKDVPKKLAEGVTK